MKPFAIIVVLCMYITWGYAQQPFIASVNAGGSDCKNTLVRYSYSIGQAISMQASVKQASIVTSPTQQSVILQNQKNQATTQPLIIQLWPNPANNFTHITISEPICYIKIFDVTGRERAVVFNTKNLVIELTNLEQGMYLVEATTNNGKTAVSKLMINHE